MEQDYHTRMLAEWVKNPEFREAFEKAQEEIREEQEKLRAAEVSDDDVK